MFLDIGFNDGTSLLKEVQVQNGRVDLYAVQQALGIQFRRSYHVSPVQLPAEQRGKINWKATQLQDWSIRVDPGTYVYLKQKPGNTNDW